MYAEYSFYSESYGGTLPEEEYNRLEPRAEAYIRYFTYLNGDIFATEGIEAVQRAVCACVDCIRANTQANTETGVLEPARVVQSESNDGYSVSFQTTEADSTGTAEEALQRKVYDAIRVYLLPTGWLCWKVGCRHGN